MIQLPSEAENWVQGVLKEQLKFRNLLMKLELNEREILVKSKKR